MLVATYKTAAELGIAEDVRDAMIRVLGMFERGEVEKVSEAVFAVGPLPVNGFDMAVWSMPHRCGTIRCIGGWVESVLNENARLPRQLRVPFGGIVGCRSRDEQRRLRLYFLFYPPVHAAYGASVAQAAQALRNYLTLGDACWRQVMEGGEAQDERIASQPSQTDRVRVGASGVRSDDADLRGPLLVA